MTLHHIWAAAGSKPQDGFGWAEASTLLAALIGALVTVAVALAVHASNQAAARRDRRAAVYAEALRGVSDYLEGPYRVRRRDGGAEQRFAVTSAMSDVKSRIDYSQALLALHAPGKVSRAFDAYAAAARTEAGVQMTQAWEKAPVTRDEQVNLIVAYPREVSDAARERVVAVRQANLALRWWSPRSWRRWHKAGEGEV